MRKSNLALLILLFGGSHLLFGQEPTNAFNDLQRKGEFNESVQQMRVAITNSQLSELLKETPSCGYFCFTEDRLNDISRRDSLPTVWLDRSVEDRTSFTGNGSKGEYYSFQIGVYSPSKTLQNPTISFSDLKKNRKTSITAQSLTCFNLMGVNSMGEEFEKNISIPAKTIQPLWIGIDIPEDAVGEYRGVATLSFDNAPSQQIEICIVVDDESIENHGYNQGWRKSRLNWLNSNIGRESVVTAPYIPLEVSGEKITYLGGEVTLGAMGIPQSVTSFYDPNNALSDKTTEILSTKGMQFVIQTSQGIETLDYSQPKLIESDQCQATYLSVAENNNFRVECTTSFSYDGFSRFDIAVTALSRIEVEDIRLEVPYTAYAAKYIMGLNSRGGIRTEKKIDWRWNIAKNQDKIWMGNINAGLNFCFNDEEYTRPLVNVYYDLGSLNLPKSWGNNCRGGIQIHEHTHDEVLMSVYSGKREMFEQQTLHYNFQMLITPVRPQNFALQSEERFYHSNSDLSSDYLEQALKAGANNINVHHKKEIYPFINYPYYDESVGDLKDFITTAHQHDVKVRAYYTTRELTVKTPEFWALRSLGGEVLHDGPGRDARTLIHSNGPHQWLNDNLGDHFIPAWFNAFNEGKYKGDMDLSVITTPDSRWNNYYLEGLDWMVKEIGLDGVYIDDSALDRITLQRARRILDADGKARLVDIHSWSHFNPYAGYANSLHLYLELLPYVDRLWIGEGFPADSPSDLWLVEMSGIPFGLMSETLDAYNIYRGMIYGMLPRLPWSGNPVPMWEFWDSFGMRDALVSGYWSEDCPVTLDNDMVKATVYQLEDRALISVASWGDQPQRVSLDIDTQKLGFEIGTISLPEIGGGIQESGKLESLSDITIDANKGLFIVVKK